MGHIQIRNVPDDVHRTLKARAAKQGMSLSEFLLAEVSGLARLPTLEEHVERVRNRPMADLGPSPGDLIRDAREKRERELDARR